MRNDDQRFAVAAEYWEAGKLHKAIAVFDNIIADEALSHSARAIVCEYVGRLQIGIWELADAERYLRRAIELNDEEVEHHVQLANCLCLQEQQEDAWHIVRRLYRDNPDHPAAIHYMGKMMDERGHHERGIELMKKSLRLEPNNERFWANLAFSYLMHNNPGAAMVCSEQAMTLNPQDEVVQFVHEVAAQFEPQDEPSAPAITRQLPKALRQKKIGFFSQRTD